ncbi:hypothetical protein [Algivirga pacifica]|uniref:Uncharacterized protein n=1 Tax=Algivirga pacifica TaxID=1162670 RepID=A0ABP9CY77_9BACT
MPNAIIQFGKSLRYAFYFLVVSGVMGLIYGAFGLTWNPLFVMIAIVGIFVVINFMIATLLVIPNGLLSLFGKGNAVLFRYFRHSLAFVMVFLAYFLFLKIFELKVFF